MSPSSRRTALVRPCRIAALVLAAGALVPSLARSQEPEHMEGPEIVAEALFLYDALPPGGRDLNLTFAVQEGEPDPVTGEVIGRHPSQLYEAFFEGLLMFLIVWWFARKPRPRGAVFGLALAYYALARSLAELVRLPDAQIGYLAGDWLTMGMLLSLPMYVLGAILLANAWVRPRPTGNYVSQA